MYILLKWENSCSLDTKDMLLFMKVIWAMECICINGMLDRIWENSDLAPAPFIGLWINQIANWLRTFEFDCTWITYNTTLMLCRHFDCVNNVKSTVTVQATLRHLQMLRNTNIRKKSAVFFVTISTHNGNMKWPHIASFFSKYENDQVPHCITHIRQIILTPSVRS